ncbi:glycosyltransferase family 2 protein [Paracrocinitomix mangrovi]|uniref:glycosyltransferase family 2 protein n=1 Tax=Paracrocinitomix mangrovi TaxID=2862509 RepID=UPI001C8E1436|nr:glycosyltransferase family 2 protein [Paracrocinitomix mangrovi]UKN03879.1 glycosyltransferase family 2 protein [Paracrocinitomix mangrovi]
MQISIVVPLYNEDESLPELHDWIVRVMSENNYTYEIIFINDGSTDNSWNVIQDLKSKDDNVRGIKFQRNYGKSAALHVGFEATKGNVVITMDADLQDSPDEIPELYKMITEEGYDLVSGWKKKRYDPLSKTIPTKIYNGVNRMMSGIKLHDMNCGLKAYRKEVVKSVEIFGEMHRYIPVIAKAAGFPKIGEKVVQHQERKYGKTKFGMNRFINGFLDMFTITFITRFGKKPMHFFGLIGTLFFILGFMFAFWLGIDKLFINTSGRLITQRPEFYLALTSMIIGSQLFLAGFIAELIGRNSPTRNQYLIEKEI